MADIFGPRCPNHKVVLVDRHKGIGICPLSGARFSYDGDEAEKTKKLRINSLGQHYYDADWKVKHIDGKGEL